MRGFFNEPMLNLAFIYHMHQPYYKNILTNEADVPWVRLHGVKDYVDMVQMLGKTPGLKQIFNIVPSLMEQVEDYINNNVKDRFLELSYRPAAELTHSEKDFIRNTFFSINRDKVIAFFPRYYDLYFKKQRGLEFQTQDYLDLQVWFNLAWVDPYFRENIPELKRIVAKARFYTEEDKRIVLEKHIEILKDVIPVYKEYLKKGQIEIICSPYYHPILPLLYDTKIAKEANIKAILPNEHFSYPQDAKAHIKQTLEFYKSRFGEDLEGMWPSEESVCEHIIPMLIESGIKWIVTDEALLFKSLKLKKRDTTLLYQPHLLKRKEGNLSIIFRDRNLSDLIGFVYHSWKPEDAVNDFMHHIENIAKKYKNEDILLTIAMDGENAWEYYRNDGHDFLELLYQRMAEADFLKTTTVSEYLKTHPATNEIEHLAAGSWIYAEFGKWIGNPHKNKAWDYLTVARRELEKLVFSDKTREALAWKQMYILEGSDWFWWYGDNQEDFDRLFRMHLSNFYKIIGKDIPEYLNKPITP